MSNRKPHFGSIFRRKKRQADGSVITLPKYWIQYSRDGRVYRESTKTENYAEAERFLERRQGELVTGRFAGLLPERVLVSQLLDDVLEDFAANARKSLPSVEGGIRLHLRPVFGRIRVASLGTNLLKKYIANRKNEDAANATINRELTILKRAFNLGYRAEPPLVMRLPHFPMLEKNNIRTGFLENDHYRELRDLLPEYLRLLFVLGYHTGGRLGELRSIQWPQVGDDRIVLHPGTTKQRRALAADLRRYSRLDRMGPKGERKTPRLSVSLPTGWPAPRRFVCEESMEESLHSSRASGIALPRFEAVGGPQHGSCRHSEGSSDAHIGTPDGINVPPIQHRFGVRPGGRQGEDGAVLV